MKEAKFTKPLTVALQPEVYEQIKQITDEKRISMAQWVRDAATTALKDMQAKEETTNGK